MVNSIIQCLKKITMNGERNIELEDEKTIFAKIVQIIVL